jgi:hypothetical protein
VRGDGSVVNQLAPSLHLLTIEVEGPDIREEHVVTTAELVPGSAGDTEPRPRDPRIFGTGQTLDGAPKGLFHSGPCGCATCVVRLHELAVLFGVGKHLPRGSVHMIQAGRGLVEASEEPVEDVGEFGRYIERLSGQPQCSRVEVQDHLIADLVGVYLGGARHWPATPDTGELEQCGLHVATEDVWEMETPHVPVLQVDSDGMLAMRIARFGYQHRCQRARQRALKKRSEDGIGVGGLAGDLNIDIPG